MLKKIFALIVAVMMTFTAKASAEKILFVPHDNRPVSCQQPIEVVEQLGYEILTPPAEILTEPAQLWSWLQENAPLADAAVVASDSLLYGGLIPSRSHEISAAEIQGRVENFKALREKNPSLQLYIFCSLMRTPMFGTPGDIEEPEYYGQYGGDIFSLTSLLDKQEIDKLDGEEQAQLDALQKKIPAEVLDDWFARREKNFAATKQLVDFAGAGVINSLIIGRDDNSPLCQTHRENRHLLAHMEEIGVPKTAAQSHAGIDEYAMLLLARAVNDLRDECPTVCVQFNRGLGGETIPDFSNEHLADSIHDEILLAGGVQISNPKRADFVLFVNTDIKGKTYEIHNSFPPQVLTAREQRYINRNAKKFSALIEDAVNENLPVGVADVIFANGADVALMEQLREKNLLFKLQAYGGWNTATNTAGFAVGTGILARHMNRTSCNRLLARRYLDDWGYQTFVRTKIAEEFSKRPDGLQIYLHLGEHEQSTVELETELMRAFAAENLQNFKFLEGLTVTNPWHRMFECQIHFADE